MLAKRLLLGRIVGACPPPSYIRWPATKDDSWLPESVIANMSAATHPK